MSKSVPGIQDTQDTEKWTLSSLLRGLIQGLDRDGDEYSDIEVTNLVLDSREVQAGSVFVALSGVQKHGLEFADKAIDKGAVAILWETHEAWGEGSYPIPAIGVDNLKEKLGAIADRFYGSPSADIKVVGVTGTDGKSTVSHFVADALNACGQKSAVIGTLGVGIPGKLVSTGLTTPDVISIHRTLAEFKHQGVQNVVMEVSSHALDQQRVAGVRFAVAMLTNLGRDHLDYHQTLEAYAEAKAKLFDKDGLQAIVLNADDDFGRQLIAKLDKSESKEYKVKESEERGDGRARLIAFSVEKDGDPEIPAECLTASSPQYKSAGIQADFHYQGESKTMLASVLGEFNLYNLLAATACLMGLGFSFSEAVDCVKQVKTVPGRMEKVSNDSGEETALVVVDYAHTPGALEAALKAIRNHTPNRVVCVFGCGGDRDRGKRPLMARVAEQNANMVVLTDDNPRSEMPFQIMHEIISGLENPEHVAMEHNRAKAIRFAIESVEVGDSVLIAGKGHETVQIVGNEKLPFDDRVEAAAAMRERVL